MTKTYTVSNGPQWWESTIIIDHNERTEEAMKQMVLFWMGGNDRLSGNDGDVTKTFLQQLGREINRIQIQTNYNLKGVVDEFVNREGWCKMDGSCGITIGDIEDFDFSYDDYEVLEAPTNEQAG